MRWKEGKSVSIRSQQETDGVLYIDQRRRIYLQVIVHNLEQWW